MFIELLKAALFGLVEGITEWLPISSTGHMILLNEFVKMDVSDAFWEMFLVVIQFGAIIAVIILFFDNIWPFNFTGRYDVGPYGRRSARASGGRRKRESIFRADVWMLWAKILVACIPAAVVGILFDDWLEAHLYNAYVVAIMLIIFGIGFIVVEYRNKDNRPLIRRMGDIDFRTALIIGIFQLIAAIFPGTSRSGATILGALLIGVSRRVAAEFTFYLAIPVMAGASLLKLAGFGFHFTGTETAILLTGMAVSFVVSVLVIRLLLGYIRKHNFVPFGIYRIVLGIIVLGYFALR